MNPIQIIAALRKFGNYLAGLFPWFVTLVNFFTGFVEKIFAHPRVAPHWKKFKENKYVQPTWKVIERFYWRTYAKNRLDLSGAPVETVALLRPTFQLCAIFCVLIPLTRFNVWPVKISAFSGFEGVAPGWSVLLWMVGLPCAWAALLTGAARSNRIACMIASISASYFLITCVVLLPRSFLNVGMPLAIMVSLLYCEYRSENVAANSRTIFGVINAIVCGISAGIPLLILTPLRPFLGTIINLPGPVISIGGGALLGAFLGLICLAIARKAQSQIVLSGSDGEVEENRTHAMSLCGWSVAILLTAFLFAGLTRGDLAKSGSQLISSLTLTTGYFWPLWYFMGVGILHKISKSSKTLATSVGDLLPKKVVLPLLMAILLSAIAITFSEKICAFLSVSTNVYLVRLLPAAFAVYKFAKPWIWSEPLNAMAVHWFSYVLLFDVILISVLALRRRFTNEAAVRLLFLNIFSFLLVWEYVFQMGSFLRTPTHSLTILFLFAVGLLWLLHTVGWDLSTRSSPAWPAPGRLAIYAGIATFALLEIFARSACKDFKVMNEVFLSMFHGVIDIGLPYYFLVWTTNRIKKLPLSIPPILGVFALGAITGLIFNLLEKLFAVGASIPQLSQVVNAQCQSLREIGSINIDLAIPELWFFIRAVLYVGLLGAVYELAKRRVGDRENAADAILFLLVAFGSGIASFSANLVELPLPPEVRAMLAPCSQQLLFNCSLFQLYLSYWIPALLLGMVQLCGGQRATARFLWMTPVAVALQALISWSYAQFEIYWRAAGSIYYVMAIEAGFFIILVALFLKHMEPRLDEPERENKAILLPPVTLIALVAALELVLIPAALFGTHLRFQPQEIKQVAHAVQVATTWQKRASDGAESSTNEVTFDRSAPSGGSSILQIGTVDSGGLDTKQLLKKLFLTAAQSGKYPNLSLVSVEPWNKYYPNALACNFSYDLPGTNPPMTMAGLSVLVPRSKTSTEFYTLHTSPSEIDHEQFELACTIKNLRAD